MRPKRLKKYLIIILILASVSLAGAAHLASIVVPIKFQTTMLEEFERAIGKKILIRSIHFNIFRGLVLEGVVIYDKSEIFIRTREVSAYVVFPELINKKILIPFIKIENPRITVERSSDGTISIAGLIPKEYKPPEGFSLMMRRVVVRRGQVRFYDRKIDPSFYMDLTGLNADVRMYLPSRIDYKISFDMSGNPRPSLSAEGRYMITQKISKASVYIRGLQPSLLRQYMGADSFGIPGGSIDIDLDIDSSPGDTSIALTARTKDMTVSHGQVYANAAGVIKADMRRSSAGGKWIYAGSADISSMDIEGIEGLGAVSKAKGVFKFDNTRIWCDSLEASALGVLWQARVNLANFASPIIDIYAGFEGKMGAFQKSICESCRANIPVEFAGDAVIKVNITMEKDKPFRMNGYASLKDVTMRLGSGIYPVEHIRGEVSFTPQKIEWKELRLYYRGMAFNTSGDVTDFSSPVVGLKAVSNELSFETRFRMDGLRLALDRLQGRYIDSLFGMTGALDITDPAGVVADVRGSLDLDLKDLRAAMKESPGVRKMKPAGRLKAEFALAGNTKDFFSCAFHAKAKGARLSLYGARLSGASMDYLQKGGLGEVKTFSARCYGGAVDANGKINWLAKAQPYSFSVKAQDVMLELIKADTGFRDADVSGDIKAYINFTGYFKDVTRLSGMGRLTITDGRLWELNLFKGLGRSVFTSDFSSIVFSEGSCDFKIAGQTFFADSIDLRGDLMRLSGSGMIGFDKTIGGVLRPEINENAMWPGTQRNIAMAVQNNTAIEISGDLKNPRFRTRTDVVGAVASALLSSE